MRRLIFVTIFLLVACTKEEPPTLEGAPAEEISAPAADVSEPQAELEESEEQKNRRLSKDHLDALKGAIIAMDVEVTLKCLNHSLPSNKALAAHLKAANPNVKMKVISRNGKSCSLRAEFEGEGLARLSATLPFTDEDKRAVGL